MGLGRGRHAPTTGVDSHRPGSGRTQPAAAQSAKGGTADQPAPGSGSGSGPAAVATPTRGTGAPGGHNTNPAAAAMPAQDVRLQRGATPPRGQPPTVADQRVIYRTLAEPYQGWREPLIRAFRQLRPETNPQGDRRFKSGYVAAAVMKDINSESFLVAARYDINSYNGGDSEYTRVSEALIRAHNPTFQRCETSGCPVPYVSGQIKARNGVKIAITIKTIIDAVL